MTRVHRRRHVVAWLLLAVLIPAGLVVALRAADPGEGGSGSDPGPARAGDAP